MMPGREVVVIIVLISKGWSRPSETMQTNHPDRRTHSDPFTPLSRIFSEDLDSQADILEYNATLSRLDI